MTRWARWATLSLVLGTSLMVVSCDNDDDSGVMNTEETGDTGDAGDGDGSGDAGDGDSGNNNGGGDDGSGDTSNDNGEFCLEGKTINYIGSQQVEVTTNTQIGDVTVETDLDFDLNVAFLENGVSNITGTVTINSISNPLTGNVPVAKPRSTNQTFRNLTGSP